MVNDYGAFSMIPRTVLLSDVSNEAKLVYVHLWDFSQGGGGQIIPRHRTLASRMGKSVASIKRYIRELVKAGFVSVETRKRGDGSHTSNLYRIRVARGVGSLVNGGGVMGDPGGGVMGDPPKKQTHSEADTLSSRATRLPASWSPTKEHVERAAAEDVDIRREVQKFRAHAEEHGRTAKNWNSAFTRWLITAAEFRSRANTQRPGPRTDSQRMLDIMSIDSGDTTLEQELLRRMNGEP